MRRIGVLGGMGPQATVLLQQRLIDRVDARDDADHVPLVIDMNPQVPSRLRFLLEGEGEDPGPELAAMACRLERAGAEALAMPCNTAHHFAGAITAAVGIPLLHMVDLACRAVAGLAAPAGAVGILASPATDRIGLFRKAFASLGLEVVHPGDPADVLDAIRAIKAQGPQANARAALRRAADDCARRGASCLLIGCSEFSLIADALDGSLPALDSLDVLVDSICAFSGARCRQAAVAGRSAASHPA